MSASLVMTLISLPLQPSLSKGMDIHGQSVLSFLFLFVSFCFSFSHTIAIMVFMLLMRYSLRQADELKPLLIVQRPGITTTCLCSPRLTKSSSVRLLGVSPRCMRNIIERAPPSYKEQIIKNVNKSVFQSQYSTVCRVCTLPKHHNTPTTILKQQ